jgi:hypothetical protein
MSVITANTIAAEGGAFTGVPAAPDRVADELRQTAGGRATLRVHDPVAYKAAEVGDWVFGSPRPESTQYR